MFCVLISTSESPSQQTWDFPLMSRGLLCKSQHDWGHVTGHCLMGGEQSEVAQGSFGGVGFSVCAVVQTLHRGHLHEWKINLHCVKALRFGIRFGLCLFSYQTLLTLSYLMH